MVALATLRDDARQLDMAGFADRHGRGFLVVHTNKDGAPTTTGFRTRSVEEGEGMPTGPMEVGVLPLRSKPASTNDFVCIGRLDGNDVCLPDLTVSKLHAIAFEDGGGFALFDAGSRNGTWIDDARVAARGEGEATRLRSGQAVRLASVTTTFLDAATLQELCRQLA